MKPRHAKLLVALFVFFLFIRLFALSADPLFIKRTGDVLDEGHWAHNPRSALLFGSLLPDDLTQSIALGSLYGFFLYLSFAGFGVSFFSMRLVNAAFGFLSIVLFFFLLKRHASGETALFGTALLGFSLTFLTYNRLALAESFLAFWLLVVFFLWAEKRYLLAGITMSAAILAKLTGLYFLPVFFLLFLFEWLKTRTFPKRQLLFLPGLIIAALSYFFIYSLDPKIPLTLSSLSSAYNVLEFFSRNIFFILGSNFFAKIDIFLLFCLALVFVFSLLQKKKGLSKLSFLEYGAIAWLIGGMLGLSLSDFPARRFLPLLYPLVILAAMGLQVKGIKLGKVVKPIRKRKWRTPFGVILAAIFGIAFFSFFNPVFARALEQLGIPISSYYAIILPAAFLVFFAAFLLALRKSGRIIALCLLSLFAIPLYYLPVVLLSHGFNMFAFADAIKLPWKILLFLGIAFGALFYKRLSISKRAIKSTFTLFVVVNLAMMAFAFSGLSFSMQQESQQLNEIIPKGSTVIGGTAHELSLESGYLPIVYNRLPIYCGMNRNVSPDFMMVLVRLDGSKTTADYGPERFPGTRFLKDIYLLPVIHSDDYRIHAKLYCVSNEKRSC